MALTTVTAALTEAGKFGGKYLHIRDEKAANTSGGTFTSGAWQTRTLNTEVTDEIGSTLSSNEFTLPAGTYYIRALAPAFQCGRHKARLYNVTDTAVTLVGTSEYSSDTASYTQSSSRVEGRFTIAAQKTFRIEHRCAVSKATQGLGVESNLDSQTEVYTVVEVWKVD